MIAIYSSRPLRTSLARKISFRIPRIIADTRYRWKLWYDRKSFYMLYKRSRNSYRLVNRTSLVSYRFIISSGRPTLIGYYNGVSSAISVTIMVIVVFQLKGDRIIRFLILNSLNKPFFAELTSNTLLSHSTRDTSERWTSHCAINIYIFLYHIHILVKYIKYTLRRTMKVVWDLTSNEKGIVERTRGPFEIVHARIRHQN